MPARTGRRCPVCLDRVELAATGRPRRYCKNACRQAAWRRVTKLRPQGAERVLVEHGLDGEGLRRLAGSCLAHVCARTATYLRDDLREDAHDYLMLVGLQTAARYDPARSKPGYSFTSLVWDIMERRMVDWFRSRLGDNRNRRPENLEAKRAMMMPLSLDAIGVAEPDHGALGVEDEPLRSRMEHAVDALGQGLSEDARWTLEHVARPLAEGGPILEVAREAGITGPRANRLLAELREELEASIRA